MTLTRLTLATLTLSTLTITACATMQVNSYVERGADVTRYRTYEWAAPDTQATGDPRLDNNEFFRGRIQSQVDRRLSGLGFELTAAAPDLVVHYHASVAQEVNANAVDQLDTSCEDCEAFVYDAGTIVVDLVDARTRRLVWRGWAEGSLDGAIDSQAAMERQIDEAITKIMERLPRRL
ncbi:MAG: DUF4136 domain-containing protein [Acidobacteria bacterium]|nr:DUF4136 domain-containing protein [Acidobacteriota bacterium]